MNTLTMFSFWRTSAARMLDLAMQLRPIRWVWTDKMLREHANSPQLDGYEPGAWVYGLDAQNVRDVLSKPLARIGLRVAVIDKKTGVLTVNYRLVAMVLFVAIGTANARYATLRPALAHMVPQSGPRMMSRWRLLMPAKSTTLRDRCHDHLASLKWFVRVLDELARASELNAAAMRARPGSEDGALPHTHHPA
ncbi:hypothetical protein LJR230_000047 [Trinickia sp. LjRoot230]|uniref:hypothetical protein n=1 Tax=Trinickia sp. LjRoot230 TaxID=3342288 RepID=UPI003ECEB2E5